MQKKNPHPTSLFRLRPTSALVLGLFAGACAAADPAVQRVAQVEFSDLFLQQPGGARIDFTRFNKGNAALAGTHRADLYVNQSWLGRGEVVLRPVGADGSDVQPCFDRAMLERIGVDLGKLGAGAQGRLEAGAEACATLPELIEAATAVFDNGEQRLDLTVPQIALSRRARGYVDPKYWDDGVTAARLQYNASTYRAESQGLASTRGYVGLNGGVNLGAWRFRHDGNLSSGDHAGTRYQSVQTHVQRGITSIRSQLVLGEAFTDGRLFDSVGFRGIQLASDDRMYPESQRGYAPVVRGIANSNARVQVRQGGNILYETTVAAGAFEIDDLYPTGYGGDLEVVVTEADGRVHTSRVPYAAAVNALRPGVTRYSLTAGQYRNPSVQRTPAMLQATVQHGFTNLLTGYGGLTVAQGYSAGLAGLALNTDYGAVGFDITQAGTRLQNQPDRNGHSARLSYSKLVAPTQTHLTVAAYRYSSRGYLSLADAMALRDLEGREPGLAGRDSQRGRLQLILNQGLPEGYGSFFVSASSQNYWNRSGSDTQFQLGYSNRYKRLNYGVSAVRQYDPLASRWDNRLMVNFSVPLGKGPQAPSAMTSLQREPNGAHGVQQVVTGALGEDNAFTYGLNAGHSGGADGSATSFGANAAYASPLATFTGSAGRSSNYTQVGAGVSGGVVAYAGGVAFTPTVGDTLAIVRAKDASGARVTGGSGLRVDPWGHAVVSNLTPFASNQIEIDPKGLPINVELEATEQRVAPTAGAMLVVQFVTDNAGRAAFLRVDAGDGAPLPFGAEVFDAEGHNVGTVAQAGRIIARGLKSDRGTLTVRWGQDAASSCRLDYALPPGDAARPGSYPAVDAACR
ncbi:fimbria/pilus outer membrane usher protein [Variovorax sp. J22P271]|uniref:fimbria/pilus outer membrane usher protein n=1 Tax=Variovorax davisae TaxID=3053515 RepID=UPI002577337A|nr:fimbria/pilus outer membrane usher protein [Variovorax sp. J22P271]MDM0031936.1 fimbria/pilus outer membrane usher protein [Variovorax sp. J22P271]